MLRELLDEFKKTFATNTKGAHLAFGFKGA